jgi:predicted metal-binding protein
VVVRKIAEDVPEEVLQQDLEKYRKKAIELGATDARIITTDMIVVDERVRAKCIIPLCRNYGTSPDCPPNAVDLDFIRKVIAGFKYAIFFMLEVPSEEVTNPDFRQKRAGVRSAVKLAKIASGIESAAFYNAYYFATAFGSGPCQPYLCPDKECAALVPGQHCRHPLMARHSLEAAGIDAYIMAARAGWDVYPIGASVPASEVPHGTRLGLVLIY